MRSILEHLPLELLELSLLYADWRSVVLCREVCSIFRTAVDSSASLQYLIALGAAHMEDGSPSAIGPATRLQMLHDYLTSWSIPKPHTDRTIPMERGGLWELYGNVLAQKQHEAKSSSAFKFLQLPSHIRGIEEKEWILEDIGVQPRDFGLDQSQDLLIIVEKASPSPEITEFRLHLRSLATGRPHQLAPKPGFLTHTQNVRNLRVSLTIQSCGEHVAVLFHSLLDEAVNQLLVWNWHTGNRETFLTGDAIRSFSFLGDRYLIIAALHEDDSREMVLPALKIWDIKSTAGEAIDMHDAPFIRLFRFPDFQFRAILVEIMIRSDPSPQWKPSSSVHVPFHQARGARLYVVTFWVVVENIAHGINVFIPSTTLLQHITPSTRSLEVNWPEWGPHGSRLLKSWHDPSSVWVCYVCGEKYVSVLPSGGEFLLVIFDFNDAAFRYMAQRDPRRCSPRPPSPYRKEEGVFEEDVVTSLMYNATQIRLGRHRVHAMCSEDSIVLVDSNERHYRILTF